MAEAIISLEGVTKDYGAPPRQVHALRSVDLEVAEAEFVVLLGPSGSGKTTLLNVLGGIEAPTSGTVTVAGRRVEALEEEDRSEFRRNSVGFVFQFFNLVPTLTAGENVQLIAELRPTLGDAADRTHTVLAGLGLEDLTERYPMQLSGGQQQRVAVARALVNQARVLLCDEPTGALDLETGRSILDLLQRAQRETGTTVVMVTHNSAIAKMADRVLNMRSGEIVGDRRVESPVSAAEVSW
ncbi:MAG: ABC transporter ATP-binding protein [Dehalococcoidia bacterium]